MKTPIQIMRDQTAKAKRQIHGALLHVDTSMQTSEFEILPYATRVVGCIGLAGLILLASCLHSTPAHAYTDEQAVQVIVGEASNQGFIGMVAVAEVLRNRGSLRGFYGLTAKHSSREPKWVWAMARKAWVSSKSSNLTHGAKYFENLAFGTPYWCKSCVVTTKIGSHTFFKNKNG